MLGEATSRFGDLRRYIITHMMLVAVDTSEPRQRSEQYSDGRNVATIIYFDERPVEIARPGMETLYSE